MNKSRKTFINDFVVRVNAMGKLPLLTLGEFFDNNTEEESIAVNQWGYGRPTLAEIRERFAAIEARPDVAWVRVMLHDETLDYVDAINDGEPGNEEEDNEIINGESIIICTTAELGELEQAIDTDWLCSDGVVKVTGKRRGISLDEFADVPDIPEGHHVGAVVWD
jgi:hypothetical protein